MFYSSQIVHLFEKLSAWDVWWISWRRNMTYCHHKEISNFKLSTTYEGNVHRGVLPKMRFLSEELRTNQTPQTLTRNGRNGLYTLFYNYLTQNGLDASKTASQHQKSGFWPLKTVICPLWPIGTRFDDAFFLACRMVAAGGTAGALARTASAPLDRIKLLFQVQVFPGISWYFHKIY
jgi:hypothetical protein